MTKEECRQEIQEDIINYLEGLPSGWLMGFEKMPQEEIDALCQIVADNFEKLEAEDDLIITQGDKKLKEMLED